MNYFLDTEFLEGTQKTFLGISKPTIDLISIGLVCENGNKYYAISKDFNLKEAWNRYDLKPDINNGGMKKEYWIRENVLKLIFIEFSINNLTKDYKGVKSTTAYGIYLHEEVEKLLKQDFTYKNFKKLINKYGKTNKQIGTEIKDFIYKTT